MLRRDFLGSALAAAQRPARPNILLLFPDQLRYDWTGANRDLAVRTPNLDALTARGCSFTKAVVGSPLCAPSRACLASGREYPRCGVRGNDANYPAAQTTVYSVLREAGYHTMGCGKIDLHKASETWGVDGKGSIREWGFSDAIDNAGKFDAIRSGAAAPKDPYMAFLHQRRLAAAHVADFQRRAKNGYPDTVATPLPDEAYCDNWIGENGLKLLAAAPRGNPWFLQVNFTGPHNPMDITSRMEKGARGRKFPGPNRNTQYDAATHTAIRQNYTAMIENIDAWTGRYIETLRRRGELDNTLIVFSSDHGEMLGDHDRWGKTYPYHASVAVPMVVAGPGVEKGQRSDALVTSVDLAATFLDFAGLAAPGGMDSRSFRPVLAGRAKKHRDVVLSGLGEWRMAWDGQYKLIHGFDPSAAKGAKGSAKNAKPLLFDLASDPLENSDVSRSRPAVVERLGAMLA